MTQNNMYVILDRMYQKRLVILAFSLAVQGIFSLPSLRNAYADSPLKRCEAYGRVIQSQLLSLKGKVICKGQELRGLLSVPVRFTCYLNQQIFQTTADQIPHVCQPPRQSKRMGCYFAGMIQCPKTRGDESFTLLEPYSDLILAGDPKFAWSEVKGADRYRVAIASTALNWSVTTDQTWLTYPSHQPKLKSGDHYQVVITALQGNTALSVTHAVINRLPEAERQSLDRDLELLRQLHLPASAQYQDIDTLYMAHGLLSESISRLKTLTPQPSVAQLLLLSQRLALAGQISQAQSQLEIARTRAFSLKNPTLIQEVQSGYERLGKQMYQSQSPSNVNVDQ